MKTAAILTFYFASLLSLAKSHSVATSLNGRTDNHRYLDDSAFLRASRSQQSLMVNPISKLSQSIPAYQGYGAYYIEIYIGSPPQRQTVMLDTGSESVALPCQGCIDCGEGHTDPLFKPSQSSTFQELTCSQCFNSQCDKKTNTCASSSSYIEGSSWQGQEVEDVVALSNPGETDLMALTSAGVKFTCMRKNYGEFKDQKADGIIGLNRAKGSFLNQLHASGAIAENKFSICHKKYPFSSLIPSRDRNIGSVSFGGADHRLNDSEMVYFDLDPSRESNYYHVQISAIHIAPGGGNRIRGPNRNIDLSNSMLVHNDRSKINSLGVILDSGSTDSVLPLSLQPTVNEVFLETLGRPFPDRNEEIHVTAQELKAWPTLMFEMHSSEGENAFIALPSSSYMTYNIRNHTFVPSLTFHDDFKTSILGSNFMRGHNVLFDNDSKSIGFAESNCDLFDTEKFPDPYASQAEVAKLLQQEQFERLCEQGSIICYLIYVMRFILFLSILLLLMPIVHAFHTRRHEIWLNLSPSCSFTQDKVSIKNSFDTEDLLVEEK